MTDEKDYRQRMRYALAFITEAPHGTDEYWWEYLHELEARNIDKVVFLIDVLKDDSWRVRDGATQVIGHHYHDDNRAFEPLIAVLSDEHPEVRAHAVEALGRIGDNRAIPAIIQALHDDNRNVWRFAVAVLIHPFGRDVVAPLVAALPDEDADFWARACMALERIDTPQARQAVEQWRRTRDE